MTIELRRIKKEYFDTILQFVQENYKKSGKIEYDQEMLIEQSEALSNGTSNVTIEIDFDKYNAVVNDESSFGYEKFSKVGMMLHHDLNVGLPLKLFYEKEFWAYLSLTSFNSIIKMLRLSNEEKINDDKIRRFYFNAGIISRTGLMFLWVMVDRLGSENDYDFTKTAFEFVDPVKAILERTMSRNPAILRAFVKGIINNNRDKRFKNSVYRKTVPNHISCYAAVNMLDAYDYNELVDTITREQKAILTV